MGLFHCPMGAPFYGDEECIDCGMCAASTQEEMVEASRKIRAYLVAHSPKQSAIRKIAVSGKGGVGKSTVVTLLARVLGEEGYKVLVVDTDESNPGLYRMLGFEKGPKGLITLLSRFSAGDGTGDAEWLKRDEISIQDIPSDYLLERNDLKFLMVGKIDDPFQGCACSMADMTRDLVGKLKLEDKEVVLIDMEAGVESFGRGVERSVDTVLSVVEPSFESMALAEKVGYMAGGMGINRVRVILNKIPTEKVKQRIEEELGKKNLKSIGAVYLDPEIGEAGFEGRAPGNSKASEDMRQIVKRLLEEQAQPVA